MKKIITITLALILVLSTAIVPCSAASNISPWAEDAVKAAYRTGMVPTMSHSPGFQDSITREQFAELAVAAVKTACGGLPGLKSKDTFTDCDNKTVLLAAQMGIVYGVGEGKFAPHETASREQIAVMMHRTIDYICKANKMDITLNKADLKNFGDKDLVSSWAYDSISMLVGSEVLKGTSNTTIDPKSPCTVEQGIVLLYRVVKLI